MLQFLIQGQIYIILQINIHKLACIAIFMHLIYFHQNFLNPGGVVANRQLNYVEAYTPH